MQVTQNNERKLTGRLTSVKLLEPVDLPVDPLRPEDGDRTYAAGDTVELPRASALQLVSHKRAREALRALLLTKSYGSLNAGEEAGFPPKEAAWMIEQGIAVPAEEYRARESSPPPPSRDLRTLKSWREQIAAVERETDIELLYEWFEAGQTAAVEKAIQARIDALAEEEIQEG